MVLIAREVSSNRWKMLKAVKKREANERLKAFLQDPSARGITYMPSG
jgi:hypothetical protein